MLKGYLHPDFANVARMLSKQIPQNGKGGAAVCVYYKGEKVVDIWGGTRNRDGDAWEEDTLSPSFSTTKGVASTLLHILIDKGLADYDDPVAKYWPEFADKGKENITIRTAMYHQAGLYHFNDIVDHGYRLLDWDYMKNALAAAKPAHIPGTQHGYHALTYGFLIGGIIEGITQKPFQQVLDEELSKPLGLNGLYIGLSDDQLKYRAILVTKNYVTGYSKKRDKRKSSKPLRKMGFRTLKLAGFDFNTFRAALLPDIKEGFNWNDEKVVQAIIPAANGMFTARSLAKMYGMMANGGEIDGVRLMSKERVRGIGKVQSRTRDKVLAIPMHWRMGFHRVFAVRAKVPGGFGHYGFGGSGACCDPKRNLSMALTLNSGVGTPMGETRAASIMGATVRCADKVMDYNTN